jgi:hypothetical protein
MVSDGGGRDEHDCPLTGTMQRVDVPGPCPFVGEVIWLTPEQGGRTKGPPPVDGPSYAQVAHVPPETVESGSASFVLRGFEPGQWRSKAEGRWLVVENEGAQLVRPGSVVVITEGPTPVAYFTVHTVLAA